MRTVISSALVFVFLASVVLGDDDQAGGQQGKNVPLTTTKDQASYAIGLNIGRNLKVNPSLNVQAVLQGIQDIISNSEPRLTREQSNAALAAFQREMQAVARQQAERNKRQGQAFLEANKKKQGVASLPSGLQYKVLKSGNGPSPKIRDTVKTHYHGTLIDGTVFDSSVEQGEPFSFQVGGQVIRGWNEAVQRMKVGDKWRLFVPSDLAYGPQGSPPVIGPNTVLIFDVELLGIE